ncbi:MAG: XrtA/PEP-CTERM system exopolysaccharide export protein [Gammaproteobacteria bacterium]
MRGRTRVGPSFAAFAVAFLIAGCASSVNHEDASPVTPKVASQYIIGPGDILEVYVWLVPEISRTVPVRPDGRITTPLVDDMQAVGKTPTQLARDIEQELAKHIKQPNVSVIAKNFVGTFREQIRVVGQAAEPQARPFREDITLLDVIIEVGGLTEFAAGNRAKIVRRTGNGPQEIKVRLGDLVLNGDISANVAMQPGDILIIPASWL